MYPSTVCQESSKLFNLQLWIQKIFIILFDFGDNITIYLHHAKVLKIHRYFQKSPILNKSSFIRHDTIYHHFDKSALTMAYCKALQSLQKILDKFTIKLIVAWSLYGPNSKVNLATE